MGKFNIKDIYTGRIEEIDIQLKVAKKRADRRTIAKLTAEKKRLEAFLQEKETV